MASIHVVRNVISSRYAHFTRIYHKSSPARDSLSILIQSTITHFSILPTRPVTNPAVGGGRWLSRLRTASALSPAASRAWTLDTTQLTPNPDTAWKPSQEPTASTPSVDLTKRTTAERGGEKRMVIGHGGARWCSKSTVVNMLFVTNVCSISCV